MYPLPLPDRIRFIECWMNHRFPRIRNLDCMDAARNEGAKESVFNKTNGHCCEGGRADHKGRNAKTIHERRDQFHSLRLGEYLDSLNPAVNSFFENLRQQQSSALAYFDTFFVFAVLSIPLVAFVFMMKRSVAQRVRTPRQSDRVIEPPRRDEATLRSPALTRAALTTACRDSPVIALHFEERKQPHRKNMRTMGVMRFNDSSDAPALVAGTAPGAPAGPRGNAHSRPCGWADADRIVVVSDYPHSGRRKENERDSQSRVFGRRRGRSRGCRSKPNRSRGLRNE